MDRSGPIISLKHSAQRRTGASGRMPPQVHEASFAKRVRMEDAGLVSKVHSKIIEVDDGDGNLEEVQLYRGRIISPQGQKLLDECAHAARPQAEARAPSLERY